MSINSIKIQTPVAMASYGVNDKTRALITSSSVEGMIIKCGKKTSASSNILTTYMHTA